MNYRSTLISEPCMPSVITRVLDVVLMSGCRIIVCRITNSGGVITPPEFVKVVKFSCYFTAKNAVSGHLTPVLGTDVRPIHSHVIDPRNFRFLSTSTTSLN